MKYHVFRYLDRCRSLLVFLTLVLAAVLYPASPAGAGGAQLGFDPSSASVPMGENTTVEITVANVSNLGGYDIFVQFDPTVVHMGDLVDAGFVTGGGNIVACNTATIDNVGGTGTVSCATISPFGTPVPGVSTISADQLVHASFTGVGAGVSPLTLTGTALQDPNGAPISATLSSSNISTGPGAVGGVAELVGGQGVALNADTAASRGVSPFLLIVVGTMIIAGLGAAFAIGSLWRNPPARN